MTEQADKYRQAAEQMNRLADLDEEEESVKDSIEEQLDTELKSIFSNSYVMSEHEEIVKLSNSFNINASDARKRLAEFPNEYIVQEHTIPDLVKKMRKARRALKGEHRTRMSKAIDTMIDAYTDHLNKCIDSITWLNDYQVPLRKMRYNEKDLSKLHKMKSSELRRETIDALCKFWEAEIEQEGMAYGKQYSDLHKTMSSAKKDFREAINKITDQSLTKSKNERQNDFILKMVCENPGINASSIHERMPSTLHKAASPNSISKAIKKLDIVSVNGSYYKVPSMIKKNIWAYTAAFIDSDGYITLDRNMNPRVGLVATGERGKAFMQEMHKSIGFGRMHLDQKSPQDTRLINRLNFYSQEEISNLLTKCLPHFRLKKGNAELLLELIRMKKSYKKEDWYKNRCDEIFKLMKWENHKDHVGFDWTKENINLDDIQKYKDNCKMSVMDSMEQIGTIIKQQERTFVITEVDYETDEHEQEDLDNTFQAMAVTAKELGIEENATSEEIENELVNWISEETGWLVNGYSYHEVRPDGTIVKSKEVDSAIDDLEEIADKYDLKEEEWESVDDASDYLFEHKVIKSSTPYLRNSKGLSDKAVNHIIETTQKILSKNKGKTPENDNVAKILKELEIANLMYQSGNNYNYAIGRMHKYIKLYVEEKGSVWKGDLNVFMV